MTTEPRRWAPTLAATVLGLAALAVFLVTLSRGAYPGISAALVARQCGLFPTVSPDQSLWHWLAAAVLHVVPDAPAVSLAVVSAVFGALGVGLMCGVVSRAIHSALPPMADHTFRGPLLALLGGITAGAALAFSAPFWFTATHAHHATLDVALLLVATGCLVLYARYGGGWLYALAFTWGAGTVEYATFIVFTPLMLLAVAVLIWQRGEQRASRIVTAVLCGLAGLLLYAAAAWSFYGTAGYALREYPGFLRIVWFMWRDQYRLIMSSLPREGWLLVLLITGAPWLAMLGVGRRGLNDDPDWGGLLLHGVVTGIAVAVLLDLDVAPWRILGHARLLVMPYVLMATLTGYLVTYWLRLALAWADAPREGVKVVLTRILAWVLALGLVGAVGAAPVLNRYRVAPDRAGPLRECAGMVADMARDSAGAGGTAWLITEGVLDDLIRLEARRRGQDLRIVDVRNANSPVFANYLASQMATPRLKNLARVGVMPLLSELMGMDGGIADRTVVFASPDFWMLAGYEAVPDRLAFRGRTDIADLDIEALVARHEAFEEGMAPRLRTIAESRDVGDPAAGAALYLLGRASMAENNLGVLLEERSRGELAFEAYRRARRMVPGNVSALLNMARMVEAGYPAADGDAIRADFEALREGGARYDVTMLSAVFGYVREPEAFRGIARAWALRGQPRLAMRGLQKALDLAEGDTRWAVKQAMAELYTGQQRVAEGETIYREILQANPQDRGALMGLLRGAASRGDIAGAEALLARATEAGVPEQNLVTARATLNVLKGDDTAARKALEDLLRDDNLAVGPCRLLMDILVRQRDWPALERLSARLGMFEGGSALFAEARALLALREADIRRARRYLDEAIAAQPGNLALQRRALRLELAAGTVNEAAARARAILQTDASDPLANYALGLFRVHQGDYELAESALRRSLEGIRSAEAANDLAWVLLRLDRAAEAEALAREAVALRPGMAEAWDTLGEVLTERGNLAEAEKALDKALAATDRSMAPYLHMARLQILKGDRIYARELLGIVDEKQGRLSSDQKTLFDRLRREAARP